MGDCNLTREKLLKEAVGVLSAAGITNSQCEARWMIEAVTGKGWSEVLANGVLSSFELKTLGEYLSRRVHGNEPLQYILGFTDFFGLRLKVRPPILIPRPETEEIVSGLVSHLLSIGVNENDSIRFLDLCSGSGCIALGVASKFPNAKVVGVDKSFKAIELARENAELLKLKNAKFVQCDAEKFLQKNDEFFDVVISNPPYLKESELKDLTLEIYKWESREALVAGDDGLFFYDLILSNVEGVLGFGHGGDFPLIVFELGIGQAESVKRIARKNDFNVLKIKKDFCGIDRCLYLSRKV